MTAKRAVGVICILLLALFAAIGGWTAEEKRFTAEREAKEKSSAIEQEEEERDDADRYWELAQDLLSDMLLEQESIERASVREGRELFSDEWFARDDRLTDPYLYVFLCEWYDGIKMEPGSPHEEDLTYMWVEAPSRAGDFEGYFIFSVWVKKTDHGVELGTDFHQKMFQYTLYEASKAHYEEKAYLAGLSPSEHWMWWYPLYDLLGEPVVMVSATEEEKLEPVFRDACERMYERQRQVSGELGQTVRFGAVFEAKALRDKNEPEYEDIDKEYGKRNDYGLRKQRYDTYMSVQENVNGYWRWLERYGEYYPTFYLDFHTGYDAEKQDIFREMCAYREPYVEMRLAQEEKKQEKEKQKEAEQEQAEQGAGKQEEGKQGGAEQEEPQEDRQCDEQAWWTVEEGDTLWEIARRRYGDGSLWWRIYERNREAVGEDGSLIFPGQTLELPY